MAQAGDEKSPSSVFQFKCSKCGTVLDVPRDVAVFQCPQCSTQFATDLPSMQLPHSLSYSRNANVVKLNVGGRLFQTTVQTLRADPDSRFASALKDEGWRSSLDEDGYLFMDRDGECFDVILSYLRRLAYSQKPDAKQAVSLPAHLALDVREKVLEEAEFYRLQGLVQLLRSAPQADSKHGPDVERLQRENDALRAELAALRGAHSDGKSTMVDMPMLYAFVKGIAEFCNIKVYPRG